MNCKQIREAIDTASRHNLYGGNVKSHLSDCPDCHSYSDKTASLLSLLVAHPRVETPPDFEFRLRARMARAQAATASDPRGFLWKIRPETFSWGQMAATAATIALVVTVSTFYIARNNGAQEPRGAVIAHSPMGPQPGGVGLAPESKLPTVEAVIATPVKSANRSVKISPASFQTAPSAGLVAPNDIAGIEGPTRLYSPEAKRLLKYRSRFYGAETAPVSTAKAVNIALTF